jgi:hypothetical protein
MKVESLMLLIIGSFFGVIGLIYWFWAYEDSGFLMLMGSTLLGIVPGLFYFYWHKRFEGKRTFFWGNLEHAPGPRPEDRDDAELADGAGEIASFPSSSIWPFCLGMGAFMVVLGLAFGWWLLFPGVGLVFTALVGVTAESRRGGHI